MKQQAQLIIDLYKTAEALLQQMYEKAWDESVTNNDLMVLRYQEGRRNALRDIVDELKLL